MTYYQLIEALKECAAEEPNINSFGFKDIYELNSLPDITYSVFYVTPNNITLESDLNRFSLNLYYIDRWDETENNQLLIHSAGLLAIRNIINRFINRYDEVVVDYPANGTLFYQKFKDMCAGVYVTITFEINSILGLCSDDN